ncbi:MAG: SUMF1/EgtB/PvdO family nonheme iron enzyme [Ardenticatenaceae bacterium]|nr:SUMF1/EgtB/PvdO family nonheme iron enzyme [Ardenticatenaceae bacterium]
MPPFEPDRQKLTQLRKLLIQHFSLDELRVLCFDLGLEYEDLPGDTRTTKIHGMIEYLQRRDELFYLLAEAAVHRPLVAWPSFTNDGQAISKDVKASRSSQRSYVHEKTGLEMLLVPAGEFLYGEENELKFLPNFWMAKAPVTNAHYEKFIRDSGYRAPKHWENGRYPANLANHPVVWVSWYDAAAYTQWSGLQLPSEQQWEKAARGQYGRQYPWGHDWKPYCNTAEADIRTTTPAGYYSPFGDSPFGCVDMSGNVWEWTNSWYDTKERHYVLRGGAFLDFQKFSRATCRGYEYPVVKYYYVGFRVAER